MKKATTTAAKPTTDPNDLATRRELLIARDALLAAEQRCIHEGTDLRKALRLAREATQYSLEAIERKQL